MKGKGKRNGRRGRPLSRSWHRWLGFLTLVPLLFVCLTGMLLNHSKGLGWDDRKVASDLILSRYGMQLEGEPIVFELANHSISEWGGQLFWDGTALDTQGSLKGIAKVDGGLAVVCERAVFIYDSEGALIEEIGDESLPEGSFLRAGLSGNGRLVLESVGGNGWEFSEDLLDYEPLPGGQTRWSEPTEATEPLRSSMKDSYSGGELAWSRVLVDLHSGRFFGPVGRWLADLMVVLVVVLSIAGVVLGLRVARSGSKEAKYE